MLKIPIEPLRELLSEAGYRVASRLDWLENDGTSEYLVQREDERWIGRGPNADDALRDALARMFPSRLARELLEHHLAVGPAATPADDEENLPPEHVEEGVESGFKPTSSAGAAAAA